MTHPHLKNAVAAAALLTLVACSSNPPAVSADFVYAPSEVQHLGNIRDIAITSSDTPVSIAAQYDAIVVAWYPGVGAATIGFADMVQVAGNRVKNYKAPSADNSKAYGLDAWSSGSRVWGGGSKAWGGGWTAWGNGGDTSKIPGQNAQIWQKIKLPAATRLAPKAGRGVVVAVIDTGIDLQHPVFQGTLTSPATWWDWVSGDANPQEEADGSSFGHGTCVAGIALQVAPNIKIMPLRVLGADGTGETANVIAAINWAVVKGAQVINLSLGTTKDKALEQAISNATQNGVFVIASAGNSGDQNVTYPASDSLRGGSFGELSIGVGSSGLTDRKSRFSTYGAKKIEMMAIGENVSSPAPGARIAAWSGTSMAAPMVTGGLALALGERSFSSLKNLGKELADDGDDLSGSDPNFGRDLGTRLNLERFLTTVLSASFK